MTSVHQRGGKVDPCWFNFPARHLGFVGFRALIYFPWFYSCLQNCGTWLGIIVAPAQSDTHAGTRARTHARTHTHTHTYMRVETFKGQFLRLFLNSSGKSKLQFRLPQVFEENNTIKSYNLIRHKSDVRHMAAVRYTHNMTDFKKIEKKLQECLLCAHGTAWQKQSY